MALLFWSVIGYLAGSCPTGYLVAKYIKKADIRGFGSGNIGATNVGRLMGKRWAVAVAVFDMFKGGIVLLIANCFIDSPSVLAAAGFFAVIGHNFPIWLGFHGGKGVATSFGVVGFYDFFCPWPAILGGLVWFIVMKKTKYVSVASMTGLFSASVLTLVFGMPLPYFLASALLALLSVWRHRANIDRLLNGTESKVK